MSGLAESGAVPPTGYKFNNGGLTNQKEALLGLMVEAFLKKSPVILPDMIIKDHVYKKSTPVRFGDVFDLASIMEFAAKYGITVSEGDHSGLPEGGWNYFAAGAGRLAHLAIHREVDTELSKFIFDFCQYLVPLVKYSPVFLALREKIFGQQAINVTAQFRIESDWKLHSKVTLQPTIKRREDFYITFDQIVAKILRTLPETKNILVFSDEAALLTPKSEMADFCKSQMGVELFWKSDFLTPEELGAFNNLELSLIDFELAIAGKNYVGISRSTFSNMVTFEKYARSRRPVTTDYVYNTDHDELGLRTDNGGRVDPRQAIK